MSFTEIIEWEPDISMEDQFSIARHVEHSFEGRLNDLPNLYSTHLIMSAIESGFFSSVSGRTVDVLNNYKDNKIKYIALLYT